MLNAPSSPPVVLTPFPLTLILLNTSDPLSLPLTLLSLSPIFLFVAYLTLILTTRSYSIFLLTIGQLSNEALSLCLKRIWKEARPYKGLLAEVGDGYGWPSSHSQAAGFLAAWGLGYFYSIEGRGWVNSQGTRQTVRVWRARAYLGMLLLWSFLTAYSR